MKLSSHKRSKLYIEKNERKKANYNDGPVPNGFNDKLRFQEQQLIVSDNDYVL